MIYMSQGLGDLKDCKLPWPGKIYRLGSMSARGQAILWLRDQVQDASFSIVLVLREQSIGRAVVRR